MFEFGQIHSIDTKNLVSNTPAFDRQEAFNKGTLKVSNKHTIYFEEYGNRQGVPVICLHGGPGFGSTYKESEFFDTNVYRVIVFDQRGAGRSVPAAEMTENTTGELVADIEKLREHLGIKKWLVFGGSWGSTLALAYGQAHTDAVLGFILRGVFTATKAESDNLIYGMRREFPEAWASFAELVPEDERSDLLTAYYNGLMDPDPKVHIQFARAFMRYDLICSRLNIPKDTLDEFMKDNALLLKVARGYMYYAKNNFFLSEQQILKNIGKVSHLPAFIVNGRYDVITPAETAYTLHKAWPKSALLFVSDAGHSSLEPGIKMALVQASEKMKEYLSKG